MVTVKEGDYHSVYKGKERGSCTQKPIVDGDYGKFNKKSDMNPWPKTLEREIKTQIELRVSKNRAQLKCFLSVLDGSMGEMGSLLKANGL